MAGRAKPTTAALAFTELLHNVEPNLDNRYHYHLRNALTHLNCVGFIASVPAGNHQLPLVVRIDQTHQIAEGQTVSIRISFDLHHTIFGIKGGTDGTVPGRAERSVVFEGARPGDGTIEHAVAGLIDQETVCSQ